MDGYKSTKQFNQISYLKPYLAKLGPILDKQVFKTQIGLEGKGKDQQKHSFLSAGLTACFSFFLFGKMESILRKAYFFQMGWFDRHQLAKLFWATLYIHIYIFELLDLCEANC